VVFRFTYAFHAREVRFECDGGQGFQRLFPETFSFHPERHDPAELVLQLEDLLTKPRLLGPRARRRDAEELVARLLVAAPRYLEAVVARLAAGSDPDLFVRACEDVVLVALLVERFAADKREDALPGLGGARDHLRKLIHAGFSALLRARVRPEVLEAHVSGRRELSDPNQDLSESALFHTLHRGDREAIEQAIVVRAERAFHAWLEDVCLDPEKRVFETEDSPFADREDEVRRAILAPGARSLVRGRDLVAFLRRPGHRDCRRLLDKLERFFLRRYDVRTAAALLHHAARIGRGADDGSRVLTRHSGRNYALALAVLVSPFLAAAFAYRRAPAWLDAAVTVEVVCVVAAAFWFLLWRFYWRTDLTVFHAAVPRIFAGIVVGYLPVFLIDEVWDLARRPFFVLCAVALLLGLTTLLFLYVEVQRHLGEPREAFARARCLFGLGMLEAYLMGMVVTTLLGPFMVQRAWGGGDGLVPLEVLRLSTPPVIGELPRLVGVEPILAFPTVVFLMTFLSLFIGTFLQLLWEDLPMTEPL
jgi:hypothetical protein